MFNLTWHKMGSSFEFEEEETPGAENERNILPSNHFQVDHKSPHLTKFCNSCCSCCCTSRGSKFFL